MQKGSHIRKCQANECETQKNVRRHPSPVVVPAVEQGQADTKPDPPDRDSPGSRVAHQKKERRRSHASEYAPPLVVFCEEITEMVNQDQDDCGGLQPVGVVNWLSYAHWTRSAVHFCAHHS